MKTTSKALLTVICAMVLIVVSVFGTTAYLTDTDTDKNTFTVGNVDIILDETNVDEDKIDGKVPDRDKTNDYHLIPGYTYIKDPTVTVKGNSEDSYIRMMVTVDNIDKLKAALPQKDGEGEIIEANSKYYAEGVFLLQMLCVGENGKTTWDSEEWNFEKFHEDTGTYEFRYKAVVEKASEDTKLAPLFTSITVPGEIDNTHLEYLKDVQIIVTAHAIQADGFETAVAAWNAFDGKSN